ncbi:hypothetical protein IHE44_0011374 [Lamprotornis superbus]|uniref:Riboflavin kinase n=2 Tax=Passeriformes TaxID=9126 RepID=A0A835NM21_9PASS|nr:hypothetical protein IHE44_0011374 [Lamprotornis superbus]
MRHLPYFCRGEVVKGFGRGSKELGIPTANFSEQVVESFPSDIPTGIYYGWACVGNGDVHKMVLSIGWNPFYKNIKKSVETHIIHTFKEDFYGEILSIVITGYIRPEKNFDSLDALISAIQEDIEEAKRQLDLPEHLKLKEDNFFHLPEGKISKQPGLSASLKSLQQSGQQPSSLYSGMSSLSKCQPQLIVVQGGVLKGKQTMHLPLTRQKPPLVRL